MIEDVGFELPDIRHTFITTDGKTVQVQIHRQWFTRDDDYGDGEPDYYCYFSISAGSECTVLPKGVDQSKAEEIAHLMYEQDDEATSSWDDTQAIYEAERRMGA